jgi:hypothetical protein
MRQMFDFKSISAENAPAAKLERIRAKLMM